MGQCFLYGNGGGGTLNFRVMAGEQAPTGQNNTVWVKTSVQTSGWIVSRQRPETPREGTIWILNGDENRINILFRNTVEISPTLCSVYAGGRWNVVNAFIFLDGEWVQWSWARYYLYENGNEFTERTNGWARSTKGTSTHLDRLTKNAEDMVFTSQAIQDVGYAQGFLRPENMISLDAYSTLCVELSDAVIHTAAEVIVSSVDTYEILWGTGASIAARTRITKNGEQVVRVDISEISGSYYVGPAYYRSGSLSTLKITKVWLE